MLLISVAIFLFLFADPDAHAGRPHHPGLAHAPGHGGDARPQRAARLHGGLRHRLGARRPRRRDRGPRARHLPGHGAGARQHRVRRGRDRRPRLAQRAPSSPRCSSASCRPSRWRSNVSVGTVLAARRRADSAPPAPFTTCGASRWRRWRRSCRTSCSCSSSSCDPPGSSERARRERARARRRAPVRRARRAHAAHVRGLLVWLVAHRGRHRAAVRACARPPPCPVMNQMGIAIVFALSYNMLLGQGGMLSFGHAVYFGLGGFIAAHALNLARAGVLWLPVPLVPARRRARRARRSPRCSGTSPPSRAGTVFAMISLGIARADGGLLAHLQRVLRRRGGHHDQPHEGAAAPRPRLHAPIARSTTSSRSGRSSTTALMYAFSRTPVGPHGQRRARQPRARGVRRLQRAAGALRVLLRGRASSPGIAGGLFAVNYEIVTAENMGLTASGAVLLMTYIGGIGYFVGPVIGAIVFTFLQSMLSDYTRHVAALPRPPVPRHRALRAGRARRRCSRCTRPAWRAGRFRRLVGPYALTARPRARGRRRR